VITIAGADSLHKVVVLNPKGGCGKTTLATNLASAYARRGVPPLIVDFDPQGYCIRWLEKRPAGFPEVYGIHVDADGLDGAEIPSDVGVMIIDLPAAIPHSKLHAYTYIADSVLLPVVPSAIDIHSATRFVSELLLDVQLDRREQKLAIVANRVKSRTRSYQALSRFLGSLSIPLIASFRDSQNFVYASALGIGVCDLPRYRAEEDTEQLDAIVLWVDKRRTVTRDRQALIARAATAQAREREHRSEDPVSVLRN